ncbi:MAG: PD40 domain-containing protein [Armatimonadetes bacterium]|nr:PD40 domain-containing protein [Armatimonadota bacterium]
MSLKQAGASTSASQFVVYTQNEKLLWLIRTDGTDERRLTDGPEDYDAKWSPDGKHIAFTRVMSHKAGEVMSDADIWVIAADGTGLTQLSSGPEFDGVEGWSPDGKSVIFTRQGKGAGKYRVKLDGSNPNRIDGDRSHTKTSFDGQWWAKVMPIRDGEEEHESNLWFGRSGDLKGHKIKQTYGENYGPVWSPTANQFVAFVQVPGNPRSSKLILVKPADGTVRGLLSRSELYIEDPTWSADGKRIAFLMSKGGEPMTNASFRQLYVMDANGRNFRRLTDHWCDDFTPQWTRDGKSIVVQGTRGMTNHPGSGVSGSPTSYVVVVQADGSGEQVLLGTAAAYGVAVQP